MKGVRIELEKARAEILRAYELGVNYFDTAYLYTGSEDLVGRVLRQAGIRKEVYIATKLPQYLVKSLKDADRFFEEELRRLRTDYVDYYLMHMFTDHAEWTHLQSLGIEEWIKNKKAEGKIRNIGFSYHGDTDMFLKILNSYDWDFCQIQYNYLDEHSQAGVRGLKAAAEKGIPVVIMEPLRGGKLVNLPAKAKEAVDRNERHYTPAQWGFKWLWNQPEVTVVLSGMNSLEMVEENCRTASETRPGEFTEEDHKLIETVRSIIKEKERVGCTGCRYCMPCPKGVDIPGNFYYYNMMYMENKSKMAARFEFAQMTGIRKNPGFASLCVKCGKCEMHCPQHLPIREKLQEADKHLRPWWMKIGVDVARKFMVKGD
jgi:predicted aldo/keto reductase-like oxidoreductase